jgi:hypothetical protein
VQRPTAGKIERFLLSSYSFLEREPKGARYEATLN